MVGIYKVKYLCTESTTIDGKAYHKIGIMQQIGDRSDMRKLSIADSCLNALEGVKPMSDIDLHIEDRTYNDKTSFKVVYVDCLKK